MEVVFMQYSEFVDEYMLIYERYMENDIPHEEQKALEEKLIQLVRQRIIAELNQSPTLSFESA
jgi:hypothetical protein